MITRLEMDTLYRGHLAVIDCERRIRERTQVTKEAQKEYDRQASALYEEERFLKQLKEALEKMEKALGVEP